MSVLARLRAGAATERPLGPLGLGVCAAVLIAAAAISAAMPAGAAARWFLAGAIALVLGFVCLRSTTQGLLATFLWLFALGLSRRLATEVLADPRRDPFILVGVAALTVLAVRALLVGAVRRLTVLAWALLAFDALAVVQLANPDQVSGLGRLAGLLIWVVPTVWFWVGRALVDDRLARRVLLLVGGVTALTAVYGVAQSVAGFPPWDRRWINVRGYAALYIGPGTVRPFATYASAAEFALACAVGAVVAATAVFGPRLLLRDRGDRRAAQRARATRNWIVVAGLVVFGLTSLGLVLSAIRTYLVLLVVALPLMYLMLKGRRAWKVLVPAILLGALVFTALAQVDPNSIGKEGAQAGIRRIIVFVHDPFAKNRENTDNTLQLHYENAKHGFEQAFQRPLGRGTSSTGLAGDQFGDTKKGAGTDFDLSDAAIAFGLAGLLLAAGIVILGFVTAVRVALWRRTFERVALVGILVVSLGAWFQGAHYAMAPLLWLLLGRADAAIARGRTGDDAPPAPDVGEPVDDFWSDPPLVPAETRAETPAEATPGAPA